MASTAHVYPGDRQRPGGQSGCSSASVAGILERLARGAEGGGMKRGLTATRDTGG